MNNQIVELYGEEIEALTKSYRELFHEQFKGLTFGTKEVRDPEIFRKWYETRAQDPWWSVSLSFFPEGRRINDRYIRLRLEEPDGTTE